MPDAEQRRSDLFVQNPFPPSQKGPDTAKCDLEFCQGCGTSMDPAHQGYYVDDVDVGPDAEGGTAEVFRTDAEETYGKEWLGFEEQDIGAWCDSCSWKIQRKRSGKPMTDGGEPQETSGREVPDKTVQEFVDSRLVVEEDAGPVSLDELWEWYGNHPSGVPREHFKWHLVHALPESVERDFDTFDGVEIKRSAGTGVAGSGGDSGAE